MLPLQDIIPARTVPALTMAIIALNSVVFLFQQTLEPRTRETCLMTFGLLSSVFDLRTLVTSIFIHGGFMHFGSNVLYLWIFGENVEDRMGHGRFALFYLLCGVVAALAQTLVTPQARMPLVGASGAIAGVIGAYFVLYPTSRVLTLFPFPLTLIEVPAIFFLGVWFLLPVVRELGTPAQARAAGMALGAHIVGFLTGVVLCVAFRRPERSKVEWWSP